MFISRKLARTAFIVAISVAAVIAPQAAWADSSPARTASAAELATSGPLTRTGQDLASAVEQLGVRSFPSIYGGIVEVNNGHQINVYLTRPEPAAKKAFQALANPGVLVFMQARRTEAALNAIHDKLAASIDQLQAQGVTMVRFYPDIATGTEFVGILGLTTGKSAAMRTVMASSDVSLFSATTADIAHASATRTADSSPFNGGDSVYSAAAGGCTTGFGIKVSGTTYLLTAGHCFLVNTAVHNDVCTSIPCTTVSGSNVSMGTVTHRATVANQLDTEYMNTRGSRLVFTGGIHDTTKVAVTGTATSPSGAQICTSGSYSGEHCGAIIDNPNECQMFFIDIDNQVETKCHLVHAYLPSGGILTEGGDSGGPVFRFSGSNALAVGTVTGGSNADSVTCTYLPKNFCSSDLYYTNISNILSLWGATIVTT